MLSDVKSLETSWPRGQNFVLGLGFGVENLSSTRPRTFYFDLVKMSVMMELVIIVSLQ